MDKLLRLVRLKYMGEGIDGFRNMVAEYKTTISIVWGDVNQYI